jgi:hypothetical protein
VRPAEPVAAKTFHRKGSVEIPSRNAPAEEIDVESP